MRLGNSTRSGFTLIELLVVMLIIMILAGILVTAIFVMMGKGDEAKTQDLFKAIDAAVLKWRQEEKKASSAVPLSGKNSNKGDDKFAGNKALYKALVTDPMAKGRDAYIQGYEDFTGTLGNDKVFVDGWKNPIVFWEWESKSRVSGSEDPTATASVAPTLPAWAHNKGSYDMYSAGEDGNFGTDDDMEHGVSGKLDMSRNPFAGTTTGGGK